MDLKKRLETIWDVCLSKLQFRALSFWWITYEQEKVRNAGSVINHGAFHIYN